MAATVSGIHGGLDTHANRPAGNTVPDGSLYSCSTHSLIYKSNLAGNSWATWGNLAGTGLTDPMTTRGDIIVRNASNATDRLARGAVANMALTSDGTDVAYKIIPGTIVGFQRYAPSSTTVFSTTSTTLADVDATNAAVTFTAPASGNVLFRVSAWMDQSAGSGDLIINVRESSSNISGSAAKVIRGGTGTQAYVSAPLYVTGLSAGSHTLKLGYCIGSGGSGTYRIIADQGVDNTDFGPLIIEVVAL
jgi:hypothetical protein